MCWVLEGGLRCASVRAHARVRAMSVCVCICAHVCVCVHLSAVRACVYACLCECMCGFVRFRRIAIPRVSVASACVRRGAVRALPSHGGGLRYL